MKTYLGILGFMAAVAGGAWIFQIILFLDRKGPFDYGWKGLVGGLMWLSFVVWILIKLLGAGK